MLDNEHSNRSSGRGGTVTVFGPAGPGVRRRRHRSLGGLALRVGFVVAMAIVVVLGVAPPR
jgi:hypothetical protein